MNHEIAQILYEIGEYLEMEGVAFRPRAYEKAAEAVEAFPDDLHALYASGGLKALKTVPGIGESIAEKIEEFILKGKVSYHEELKKKTPVNLAELTKIEGLGPKKIKVLYERLNIKDIKDLKKAVAAGKIRKLEGFGEKSEENLKKGMGFLADSGARLITGYAIPVVEKIVSDLRAIKGVKSVTVAGSYRRRRDTIGDADILVISNEFKKTKEIMDFFVSMPEVVKIAAQGDTRSAVKLKTGLNVDLRVLGEESFGAALNYFTGSKDHNIALREIAIKKGFKLSEYGLFSVEDRKERGLTQTGRRLTQKEIRVAGRTEEEIYEKLGLVYIPPELRENTGEIELAMKGKLPKIIEYGTLRGDLQIQTSWTDGANSILEMAEAARKLGREYIAITDHTKNLAMTGGLDVARIKKQIKEIDELNLKFSAKGGSAFGGKKTKFRILKGTECDILKDGRLDLPDEILSELDVVGVSVHSNFNLSREEQTKRVKRAMSNPHADIFFHPTGRVINKRPGYDVDIDEVIRHAKSTKTVLEINAFPDRSDLSDKNIRKCVEKGLKLAINSDAHAVSHLNFLEYGISQARRGWAKREDIINTYPVEKMLSFLKDNKKK